MHVYYKFGLFLIFILSLSTCYTRAAPASNQSSSFADDYDYYDQDYEDDNDTNGNASTNANVSSTQVYNRLMMNPTIVATTPETSYSTYFNNIVVPPPKRSNHVLEPACPKACLCMEDYKYIQCSNARLKNVPDDIPSTALIIDLSNNHIKELHADDFANCSKVREINLNGNELMEVKKEVFDGLNRLQRLRLANNKLTGIKPDTFTGASDLTILDLSNNTITLRSDGSFLNQPELLELSCRNCTWTKLYDDTFANLTKLTALKLDYNDFNQKINTKAFTPLRDLIKLRLPQLDQPSVIELCNLLKSIDNISFKHFDVSCYELVLDTSFNESLILATDPPYKPPVGVPATLIITTTESNTAKLHTGKSHHDKGVGSNERKIMTKNYNETYEDTSNLTVNDVLDKVQATNVLTASVLNTDAPTKTIDGKEEDGATYQVPVSQETINIMLIVIIVVAIIGLIIGIICRKDVGGIKTKCCRTGNKPEPKDQVHPTEEIPLNKLA